MFFSPEQHEPFHMFCHTAIFCTIKEIAINNDIDSDLLKAYADNLNITDPEEALEHFQEDYAGTWDDLETWAIELLEDTGELEALPNACYYFDYLACARGCELGGDIYTISHGYEIAVFWNC
jgi:antirestriction protein